MAYRELIDWSRFEAFHQPLPDRLSDLHSALLQSLIVNLTRSADATPVTATDFFVLRDRPPPVEEPQGAEVDRAMKAWRGGS